MTTPAVNIDGGLNTFASTTTTLFEADGTVVSGPTTTTGTALTQWRTYQRPASQKSVKDKSGWRRPLPYSLTSESSAIHAWQTRLTEFITPGLPTSRYRVRTFNDAYGTSWREPRPTNYDSNLIDRAVSGALLKLKSQSVNFGVAFGEYKETAELVTSVAHRIGSAVRSFRGKYPRDWGQVVKNQVGQAIGSRKGARGSGIPNGWLELQYGWNPLLADVNSAASQLSNDASSGHPFRCHVKAKAKSPLNRVTWGQQAISAVGIQLIRTGQNFAYVRLDFELDSPLLATLSSLGLTNPLEIVWELVPYSFVVDWIVPVGNWLSTLDATFGWKFLGGTLTQGYDYSTVGRGVVWRPELASSSRDSAYGEIASTQKVFSFARSVYTSAPRAGFPTVKNPLSVGHMANALSLLINAFR